MAVHFFGLRFAVAAEFDPLASGNYLYQVLGNRWRMPAVLIVAR